MKDEKRDDAARVSPSGHRLEPDIDPATDLSADPPRDPALGAALRVLTGGAVPRPDWTRLSASIRAAAAPQLALRRDPAPWWQHTAGWATQAIPVGLAAGVALTIGLRILGPGTRVPDHFTTAPTTLEEVLAAAFDEPQGELAFPGDGDELLRAALLSED